MNITCVYTTEVYNSVEKGIPQRYNSALKDDDKDGKVIPDNMVEIFLREIDPISVIFLGEDRYEVILEEDIEGFDDLFEEYDETTKHK